MLAPPIRKSEPAAAPLRSAIRRVALESAAERSAAQGPSAPSRADFGRIPLSAAQPAPLAGFPHADAIGRRLGRPILAPAVVDPAGCAAHGAPAFTRDGEAHFSLPSPSLRVAAHEAVHVLQQRGATRDMALGAEGQAAAVERIVAAAGDARALIGQRGARAGPGPHLYTLVAKDAQSTSEWNAGADLRVSEDGFMAVKDDHYGSHEFWADPLKIGQSNSVLATAKAAIQLEAKGTTLTGSAPADGGQRSLIQVSPKNLRTATEGDTMTLVADCGDAARAVTGADEAGAETRALYHKKPKAGARGATPLSKTSRATSGDPNEMEKEVLKGATGAATGAAAQAQYRSMSAADREAIDKRTGINKYAAPSTGESYAISTGPEQRAQDWNFHWGGVVMTSGSDRVTMENWADEANPINSEWEFQMYGSAAKPGQTFHEQQQATDKQGTMPVTMRVGKRMDK